jgi:hypothetical protein
MCDLHANRKSIVLCDFVFAVASTVRTRNRDYDLQPITVSPQATSSSHFLHFWKCLQKVAWATWWWFILKLLHLATFHFKPIWPRTARTFRCSLAKKCAQYMLLYCAPFLLWQPGLQRRQNTDQTKKGREIQTTTFFSKLYQFSKLYTIFKIISYYLKL